MFHSLKAMEEMMAENYHNIWAKKKKMELESKGNIFQKSWLKNRVQLWIYGMDKTIFLLHLYFLRMVQICLQQLQGGNFIISCLWVYISSCLGILRLSYPF